MRNIFRSVAAVATIVAVSLIPAPSEGAPAIYVNAGHSVFSLQRANIDGTDLTPIVSNVSSAFAIDEVNRQIYFAQESPTLRINIARADLDGSNVSTYLNEWRPDAIEIDAAHNRAFFSGGHVVHTAALTNPTPMPMHIGLNTIVDIQYDSLTDTVLAANYLSTIGANQVRRITPGDEFAKTVVGDLTDIAGIALDESARKIYFSARRPWPEPRKIYRADADDGSNVELLIDMSNLTTYTSPNDIEVVPQWNAIFWADDGLGAVYRANLDGTNIRKVMDIDLPRQIEILVPEPSSVALSVMFAALCCWRRPCSARDRRPGR